MTCIIEQRWGCENYYNVIHGSPWNWFIWEKVDVDVFQHVWDHTWDHIWDHTYHIQCNPSLIRKYARDHGALMPQCNMHWNWSGNNIVKATIQRLIKSFCKRNPSHDSSLDGFLRRVPICSFSPTFINDFELNPLFPPLFVTAGIHHKNT